jgi:hypothetical protein
MDALGLTRPTILRMAGVPESTFYSWQKNPSADIRTPSVSRLLRLQAQVGLLAEALGVDRTRSWILSGDRFERLQGDEAAFAGAMSEAAEALAPALQLSPRRRMRAKDYEASEPERGDRADHPLPRWPGASKSAEGDH